MVNFIVYETYEIRREERRQRGEVVPPDLLGLNFVEIGRLLVIPEMQIIRGYCTFFKSKENCFNRKPIICR